MRSLEDVQRSIAAAQAIQAKGLAVSYVIFDNGQLAGVANLARIVPQSSAELIYWLGKRFLGRGLAFASCQLLLNYAFEHLKVARITAQPLVNNAKSTAVLDRLGFKREGVVRSAWNDSGQLKDVAIYGIIAPEWQERATRSAPSAMQPSTLASGRVQQ